MPEKLAPPLVVRRIASQIPCPDAHRAVPSTHHSSRLTAVNELGWKSVGMPAGGALLPVMNEVVEVVGVEHD